MGSERSGIVVADGNRCEDFGRVWSKFFVNLTASHSCVLRAPQCSFDIFVVHESAVVRYLYRTVFGVGVLDKILVHYRANLIR